MCPWPSVSPVCDGQTNSQSRGHHRGDCVTCCGRGVGLEGTPGLAAVGVPNVGGTLFFPLFPKKSSSAVGVNPQILQPPPPRSSRRAQQGALSAGRGGV